MRYSLRKLLLCVLTNFFAAFLNTKERTQCPPFFWRTIWPYDYRVAIILCFWKESYGTRYNSMPLIFPCHGREKTLIHNSTENTGWNKRGATIWIVSEIIKNLYMLLVLFMTIQIPGVSFLEWFQFCVQNRSAQCPLENRFADVSRISCIDVY